MSPLLQTLLSAHVIFGLVGVTAVYAVLMSVLKREPSLRFLKYSSLTAFVSYLTSWMAGGYYYVVYYGGNVKPIIKAGDFPWAHLIFMEAKEHVFLFLPFASLALVIMFWVSGNKIISDTRLKNAVALFAATVTVIAIFVTISGMVVSGAVR